MSQPQVKMSTARLLQLIAECREDLTIARQQNHARWIDTFSGRLVELRHKAKLRGIDEQGRPLGPNGMPMTDQAPTVAADKAISVPLPGYVKPAYAVIDEDDLEDEPDPIVVDKPLPPKELR